MSVVTAEIETPTEGRITDAQFDYFGARLAIADSCGKIVIRDQAEVTGSDNSFTIANAHSGEISQIAWCHPQFGCTLISGGKTDKAIKIWKEADGEWKSIENFMSEHAGVMSIRVAPKEYGCIAVVGFEDWLLSYVSLKNGMWNVYSIGSHSMPVRSITFGPSTYTVEEMRGEGEFDIPKLRIVTCTGENSIYMWKNIEGELFESSKIFSNKDSWFVDAAWCDNIGLENDIIAAASLEGCVFILQKLDDNSPWKLTAKIETVYTPHKVGWNGTVLCVSTVDEKNGSNQTELYKEPILKGAEQQWELISTIQDSE